MEAKGKEAPQKHKFSFQEIFATIKNFFLATRCTLGMEIGSNYIKIVQLQKARNDYVIAGYRVRALPTVAKENPQEKRKLITGFLQEFITESRIRTRLGRLALWGGGVYLFSLTVPGVSEKDLRSMVNVELKKRLPFQVDLTNILSNFFVTAKYKEEKGTTFQVTCIAIDKFMLEGQMMIFKDIGVRPTVINVIPDALGNLTKCIDQKKVFTAVLDIGSKESVLNFYREGMLQFSRQVPIGGAQFTQAIMKAMTNLGMNGVNEESAEKVKRQCGIPLEEEVFLEYFTDLGVIKGNQIATALRPFLERFNTEVTRTINYYYRTYRTNKIDAFYLTGGSSRLKNIAKFLEFNLQNLNVASIKKLNPLSAVKGWMDSGVFRHEMVMEEAAPHLGAVFGLSLAKGGGVNLLPPKEIIEQKVGFISTLVRILFCLALGTVLAYYSFVYGRYLIDQKNINIIRTEITKVQPKVNLIKSYMAMQGALTQTKSLLEQAIGRQPYWYGVLKELSNIIPEGVVLDHLEAERKGTRRELRLSGEVIAEYTTIEVAFSQFHGSMDSSPYFTNIRPVLKDRDVYSEIPKASFEITCDLVF